MVRLLRLMVRLYQYTLGAVLPDSCRFQPTCSHYALEALAAHGAARGSLMALRRILRCHPFSVGGYDPVPPANAGLRATDDACPGHGHKELSR